MYNAIPYMIQYRVIAYTCTDVVYITSMTELVVIYTYIILYRTGSSIPIYRIYHIVACGIHIHI